MERVLLTTRWKQKSRAIFPKPTVNLHMKVNKEVKSQENKVTLLINTLESEYILCINCFLGLNLPFKFLNIRICFKKSLRTRHETIGNYTWIVNCTNPYWIIAYFAYLGLNVELQLRKACNKKNSKIDDIHHIGRWGQNFMKKILFMQLWH